MIGKPHKWIFYLLSGDSLLKVNISQIRPQEISPLFKD